MHPSLNIDEIIQNIFSHFDKKGALFVLAVVCRAWTEPANDALWARLEGLRPLICCLPQYVLSDSETVYGALTIVQAPGEGEWKRFDQNARRVKHLLVDDSRLFSVDHAAMEILGTHHADPILPNLTHLEWHGERIARHIHLFVRPSLVSLAFTPHGVQNACAILNRVETHAPELHELRVISHGHTREVMRPHVLRTMMTLKSLTSFDDNTMNLAANDLLHFSKLKYLRTVSLTLKETNAAASERVDWGGFPGVTTMSITTTSTPGGPCFASRFISRLPSATLTTLTLSILPPTNIPRLQADLSALGNLRHLETFTLQSAVDVERWDDVIVDGTLFSPMSRITTMKSFAIQGIPVVLPRRIIHEFTASWTRLESFTAMPLYCISPLVRLEDLHLFSQYCPCLRTMSVYVCVEPEWAYKLADPLVPSSLRSLDLAFSRIILPASTRVASYLAAIFPSAEISRAAIGEDNVGFVALDPFIGAEALSLFNLRIIELQREPSQQC